MVWNTEKSYIFPPKDYQVMQSHIDFLNSIQDPEVRYSWFCGGVGSGKTYCGVIAMSYLLMQWCKGGNGLIVCPTLRQYKENIFPLIEQLLPPFYTIYALDNRLTFRIGDYESTVYIRTASDHRQTKKIQGLTVNWVWIDEPCAMSYGKDALYESDERIRAKGLNALYITGSPKGLNWLCGEFGITGDHPTKAWITGYKPQPDHYVRASTSKENKALNATYVERLESRLGETLAKQELNAHIISETGLLFSEFSPELHVIPHTLAMDMFNRCNKRLGGADFAYRDYSGLLVAGMNSAKEFVIVDEYYKTRQTTEMLGKKASQFTDQYNLQNWVVDGEDLEAYSKWKYGYSYLGKRYRLPSVDKAKKSNFLLGRDSVRSRLALFGIRRIDHPAYERGNQLGRPGLYISDRVFNLKNEFLHCRYEAEKQDKPPSERTKGADHLLDCLRYIVTGALPENELIFTPQENLQW